MLVSIKERVRVPAQLPRVHRAVVAAALNRLCLRLWDGCRSLQKFPRRFPRLTLARFRRPCRMPESISIRCCGKSFRIRITVTLDRSQLRHRTVQARAAVWEPETARVLAKVNATELGRGETGTLALGTTARVAVVQVVRTTTTPAATSSEYSG